MWITIEYSCNQSGVVKFLIIVAKKAYFVINKN